MLKSRVPPQPGFKCHLRRNFADAFRNWRRKKRLPQKQVAIELGFSIATISKWERGAGSPDMEHLELVIEYTGQSPCHLLCIHARRCRNHGCLLKRQARG